MGRSDGGLAGPQHMPAADADRIAAEASRVIQVRRDALGLLAFVAPCGCVLVVDPVAWSRRRPDQDAVEVVKAAWISMVDHVFRGTPCPDGGTW